MALGKKRHDGEIWAKMNDLVNFRSGSVCLDVINQTWSPMFDMINIFEVFLPQLLRYPNPTDPLNGEAAALIMREPKGYDAKVKGTSVMVLTDSPTLSYRPDRPAN